MAEAASAKVTSPIIDYSLMVELNNEQPPTDLIARITPDLTAKMVNIKLQYDRIFKNASMARKCRKELDSKAKAFDETEMATHKEIFEKVTDVFNTHSELSVQAQKVKEYVGACIRHFQQRGAQYQTSAHPLIDATTRTYLNAQSEAAREFVTVLNSRFAPTSAANLDNINTEMKNTKYELGKIGKYFPTPQEEGSKWTFRSWWSGSNNGAEDLTSSNTVDIPDALGEAEVGMVHGPLPKPADHVDTEDQSGTAAPTVAKPEVNGEDQVEKPAPTVAKPVEDAATRSEATSPTGVAFVDAETHVDDLGEQIGKSAPKNHQPGTRAAGRRRIAKKKKSHKP